MNWLVSKLRGGRISLTIKELKYDIDNALNARRAMAHSGHSLAKTRCQLCAPITDNMEPSVVAFGPAHRKSNLSARPAGI